MAILMITKRLLPLTAVHKRLGATLFSGLTLPFSQIVSWTNPQEGFVLITATGLTTGLTLSISGTLNGITQTEIVSLLSSINQVRSTNKWSTITQISSTGSPGVLFAKMVFGTGQPILQSTTINSALKGRLRASRLPNTIESGTSQQLLERWYFYTNDLSSVAPSDILNISGVDYEVESAERVYGGGNTIHHTRLFLKRFN